MIAQAGSYMSELGDVDVGCDLDCSLRTCLCAGLGLCRQKITGADESIAFLAAGGTIVYKNIKAGETVTIDTNSVVAYEDSIELGITPNGKLCTCICGGEGCFSTTMTGPGRIYLQVRVRFFFFLFPSHNDLLFFFGVQIPPPLPIHFCVVVVLFVFLPFKSLKTLECLLLLFFCRLYIYIYI